MGGEDRYEALGWILGLSIEAALVYVLICGMIYGVAAVILAMIRLWRGRRDEA